MRLSSSMFAVAAAATTGLAIYVLFAGSREDSQLKKSAVRPFQTVGENRLLNLVRRNKIRIGDSGYRRRLYPLQRVL